MNYRIVKKDFARVRGFRRFVAFLMTFILIFSLLPMSNFTLAATVPNNSYGYLSGFTLATAATNGETLAEFSGDIAEYDITAASVAPYMQLNIAPIEVPEGKKLVWRLLAGGEPLNIYGTNTFGTAAIGGTAIVAINSQWSSIARKAGFSLELGLFASEAAFNGTAAKTMALENADLYQFNVRLRPNISGLKVYQTAEAAAVIAPEAAIVSHSLAQDTLTYCLSPDSEYVFFSYAPGDYNFTIGTLPNIAAIDDDSNGRLKLNLSEYLAPDTDYADVPVHLEWKVAADNRLPRDYTLRFRFKDYYPRITAQPSTPRVLDKNENAEISVAANLSPDAVADGGTLLYQWECAPSDSGTGSAIAGANEATFNIPTDIASSVKFYRCKIVSVVNGENFIAYSSYASVRVNLSGNIETPLLSWQGGVPEIKIGQSVYFSLNFSCPDDASLLDAEYKFYRNTVDSTDGGILIDEGTIDAAAGVFDLIIPPVYEAGTYYYYAKVTLNSKDEPELKSSAAVSATVQMLATMYDSDSVNFEGEGTEISPYLINSAEDFAKIRQYVNVEGNLLPNVYFKMTDDIELPPDWEPIGSYKPDIEDVNHDKKGPDIHPFSGILDGDNHLLTIPEGGKPLFHFVQNAEVKNLNIYGTRINGAGLVSGSFIDYGASGLYAAVNLNTIKLDNVTLKSGSQTRLSGLVHDSGFGANNINNCVVEPSVIIGYDTAESGIGSFAGRFAGRVTNSVSYATVKGVNNVGGLVGVKNQFVGLCEINNSGFIGDIIAEGERVGGIIGSGSETALAPVVTVKNCYVFGNISGQNDVGGILGSEPAAKAALESSTGAITDNIFYGTINATAAEGRKGGIIGYYSSLDRYQVIANNFYFDENTATGIGELTTLQTGFDAGEAAKAMSAAEFSNGTVRDLLNASATSFSNWVQGVGDAYPTLSYEPVIHSLSASGDYKRDYFIGDALDLSGIEIRAQWTSGETTNIPLNEINVSGYDKTRQGVQTLTLTYGAVSTTIEVTVLKKAGFSSNGSGGTPAQTEKAETPAATDTGKTGETAVVNVPAAISELADGTFSATASVDTDAVMKAVEEAVKSRGDNTDAPLEIKIVVKNEEAGRVTSAGVELIVEAVREMAKDASLTIESDVAAITFGGDTLAGIAEGRADDEIVRIVATDNPPDVTAVQREAAGNNALIDLGVWVGKTRIHDFQGEVTVAKLYTPPVETNAKDYDLLTVYHLDNGGAVSEIPGAYFDADAGQIVFTTSRFSKFIIAEWICPFDDIKKSDWFYKSTRFGVQSLGITGTGDGKFDAKATSSRAALFQILANYSGADTTGGAKWYEKAVAWAVNAGITDGTAPTNLITREQVFQLLYNFSGAERVEADLSVYSDAGEISVWASNGVNWAVATGLVSGRTSDALAPRATITRAELVALLQKFIGG
jgi:hypothetical protein